MPSNQYRPLTKPYAKTNHPHAQNRVVALNQALTVFAAAFLALSILSAFARPSSSSFSSPSWSRGKTSSNGACDPFTSPGFISSLPSGLSTYRTFDPSCSSPGLLPTLLSHLPNSPYSKSSNPPKQAYSISQIASAISNKTVLLVGDSTDRTLVQHFCSLTAQRQIAKIDMKHPWGRALAENSPSSAHALKADQPLAHYCYLSEFDFLLTSVYHFGTDLSDTFQGKPSWTSPSLFEERVTDLFLPFLQTTTKSFPIESSQDSTITTSSTDSSRQSLPLPRISSQPDLILFASTFWDLALFAQQDIEQLHALVEDLGENRLLKWRGRNIDMLKKLAETFPKSPLAWRSLHAPSDSERATIEWWTGTQGKDDTPKNHPLFHLNRIHQLNSARQSALYPQGDDVVKGHLDRSARLPSQGVIDFDWGTLLLGQDHRQVDPIHPSLSPGGSVFGEMLLTKLMNLSGR